MKLTDPYAYLGIPRDADEKEIRSAFRRRSKNTHPDGGGSAEEFAMTTLAQDILLDPERRKRFDETGCVDETKPNNDIAAALQIIEEAIAKNVDVYARTGFNNPFLDPRKEDLIGQVRRAIGDDIRTASDNIEEARRAKEFFADMADRILHPDPENPLRRRFILQGEEVQRAIDGIGEAVRLREKAIELLKAYGFRTVENGRTDAAFRNGIIANPYEQDR